MIGFARTRTPRVLGQKYVDAIVACSPDLDDRKIEKNVFLDARTGRAMRAKNVQHP